MPALLRPADTPPAPILLQRPLQNQQARLEGPLVNQPAVGAAATVVGPTRDVGVFRDGTVVLPESE
eukprot:4830424-Alexandrium_andersonii.AAC.1